MRLRRCILAGLWILSLITISFYGGAVSYGFFFGVSMVPVISFLYLLCVYARFKIYQETTRRSIVCGQREPYFFTLQNDDYFSYVSVSVRMHSSFSYVEDSFEDVEYELFPGDRSVFETKIVCKYRGEYEIGVKDVFITDFFRLFRLRYAVSGQIKALVAPRIVKLSELKSIADLPVLMQREAMGDSEADILVRDYVEGDSLKQIHWKATAREGQPKVRTTLGKESRGISIFCDTRRYSQEKKEYLPLENKILEAFLAVGFFFADKNRRFTAFYGQKGITRQQVEGLRSFEDFYKKVSELSFGEEEDLGQVLEEAVRLEPVGGIVFCVLHELSPVILEVTERMTAGGVIVVLYLVTQKDAAEYVRLGSSRRKIVVLSAEEGLEGRM